MQIITDIALQFHGYSALFHRFFHLFSTKKGEKNGKKAENFTKNRIKTSKSKKNIKKKILKSPFQAKKKISPVRITSTAKNFFA